jgi:sugar diacid utilization regulator
LRDAGRDSRRLLLGESRPTLIDRTSRAYGEALRALVAARSLPRYAATYRPSSLDLTQVLGTEARRWAAQFLRPMFQLPPGSRTVTAGIVADALLFGTGEAARMTGVHRNTVTSHLKEVRRRMELDLGRYPDRAALVLALKLAPFPADPPLPGPAVSLRDVLADASCHDWAAELTASLKPELKRTLTAWLIADGRIDEALSARLGLHTNTIRKHLGRCEQLLSGHKPLIRHKEGAYEATLALHILGDLKMADFVAVAVP